MIDQTTTRPDGLVERIISASFQHRGLVLMMIALAAAFGIMGYQQLPRSVYPDLTIPVFTIVTENEAMAPEEIELAITRPMEAAMSGLPGVRRIRSQTTQGLSSVIVDFALETDFWKARQFVTERMAQVAAQLPPGTEPPTLGSATTRMSEVYEYWLEGALPLAELREIAEWQVRPHLLTVPGVADVLNMGGYLRQYRITIRPERLASYGLTLSEVEEAIRASNENASGGFVSTGPTEHSVRSVGRFDSIEEMDRTVIASRNGTPIFLDHVADVTESTATRRGIATRNGNETVVAIAIKQQNADTVEVVKGIERALEELRPMLPSGVRVVPYYDQTRLIEDALRSVTRAILVGGVLVIVVLFAFLGHLRTTMVVAICLPLAAIIAGGVMRALGVGLNTMSLGGLAIAVGIMVDAAIIMLDNIHHRLRQSRAQGGTDDQHVAHEAARAVGRPIAFATLIIVAVFLPLFLMGGVEGLMFRPLAVTVAAAMLVSLLLALTLVPVLAARVLSQGEKTGGEARFVRAIAHHYEVVLERVLRRRWLAVTATSGLLVAAGFGLTGIGRDFMPTLNEGAWLVSIVTPPETSLEEGARMSEIVDKLLRENPNVEETVRRNGHSERAIGCVLPVNLGEITVNLKPRRELTDPPERILIKVREEIENIPGLAAAFTQPLQMKMDEGLEGTPAPLHVKLFGPDLLTLVEKASQIREAMERVPGLADIKMDQVSGVPQLQVRIDRDRAARYGISVAAISEVVHLAIGGEELTQVWKHQRSYGVLARFPEGIRNNPEAIANLLVDAPGGQRIPLSQVATVTLQEGPNVIWREAMSRRLGIEASIEGRDLASVVADIKREIADVDIPAGYSVVFAGQFESQQRAMRFLAIASALALFIVFMLLFTALGSAPHSLIILLTVPSAFVGGVASLWLSGGTLNVSSAVGFIALFGIAVQNSLVLLTQTKEFLAEGHSREQAVRLASVQRLRPKLMTASCTALGLVPILVSGGIGAEIEKPLAVVMIGGLVTSTLFTLLVLPCVYLLAERLREGLRGRQAAIQTALPPGS